MYVTFVVTCMTLQRATLIAASLQEQRLKTFLRIGFAQSAESARVISPLLRSNIINKVVSERSPYLFIIICAKCQMMMPAVTDTFIECFVPNCGISRQPSDASITS